MSQPLSLLPDGFEVQVLSSQSSFETPPPGVLATQVPYSQSQSSIGRLVSHHTLLSKTVDLFGDSLQGGYWVALILVSPSFVLPFPMLMSLDGWLQLSCFQPH